MLLRRKGNFPVLRTVISSTVLLLALAFLLSAPALAVEVSELTVDFPLADVLDIPQEEETETGEGGQARVPRPGFRAPWEDDWYAFRQNVLRGNLAEAEKYLDKIENYRIKSGIPNLYIPAAALLFEAARAREQSRYSDAYKLIEYSKRLAPDESGARINFGPLLHWMLLLKDWENLPRIFDPSFPGPSVYFYGSFPASLLPRLSRSSCLRFVYFQELLTI
jgi:hypothetical protein